MTTILITFLGKMDSRSGKRDDSYESISYRFPDGTSYRDESNFALVPKFYLGMLYL